MKNILLALSLALSLSSCSNGGGSSSGQPARPQFQGDLIAKAQEIYDLKNSDFFYACDHSQRDKVLEIAAAVEKNRSQIQKLQEENIKSNANIEVKLLNGFKFLKRKVINVAPDYWETDSYSWGTVYYQYSRVKNDPTNEEWLEINSNSRSLIVEDDERISYATHPSKRRANRDIILSAFNKIETCQKNYLCTQISFSVDELSWLQEGIYQSYILSQLPQGSISQEKKRKWIDFLYRDVGYAARRFGFEKNPTLSVSNGVLQVPIDFSVLGSDESTLLKHLQSTWSQHGLKLNVFNSPNGYKVQISNTPGERAYVNSKNKMMQLYSPTSLATVEHEFGHVLGLMDTYFTSFDKTSCAYVDEYNRGDMMSTSGGSVLPLHIEQIKKTYGL